MKDDYATNLMSDLGKRWILALEPRLDTVTTCGVRLLTLLESALAARHNSPRQISYQP